MNAQELLGAEVDRRVTAVQQRMETAGLDGLIVADPANIYYLTGYNAWSFYMPQLLFVPVAGEPILAMREMDAQGAHRTAVRFADDVLAYPETYVHQSDRHPMTWVGEQLRARGYGKPLRIGYEGDAHFFSVRAFLALQLSLPEWLLVDSNELVNWVRVVKSDYEIDLMRAAGRVCTGAMNQAVASLAAGRPLNEVAAEVMAAQARGADGVDGDYPAIVPMFPRGEGADTPHLTWTAEPVTAREAVSIELAGVHKRYHAPLARTVSLGQPTAELDRLAQVTIEGLNTVLDALKPGTTPAAAVARWDEVLKRNGYEKRSRLGYSIGIGFPPDWGEHTVSLRADDHTELQENMTFHVIAGMWMTGYGFEASESVRVSTDGVECFTDVPRQLIVKKG
ncbi:M24 family metallopeptidase [Leucobacter sp. HY1908]